MKNCSFRKRISLNHELTKLLFKRIRDRKFNKMIHLKFSKLTDLKSDKIIDLKTRIKNSSLGGIIDSIKSSAGVRLIQDRLDALFFKFPLLIFYITLIWYLEFVYRIRCFNGITFDFVFPVLFALPAGAVLFSVSRLLGERSNRLAAVLITSVMSFLYAVQLIYFGIFRTPLLTYSLIGAGDALKFVDVIYAALAKNAAVLVLIFGPVILLIISGKKLQYTRMKPLMLRNMFLFCIAGYVISMVCVHLTGKEEFSQYSIYFKGGSPELSVSKLGLMTTMRLDVQRLIHDYRYNVNAAAAFQEEETNSADDHIYDAEAYGTDNPGSAGYPSNAVNPGTAYSGKIPDGYNTSQSSQFGREYNPGNSYYPGYGYYQRDDFSNAGESGIGGETDTDEPYNIMNIDFEALIANEKDKNLLDMHRYFSSVEPTKKNKYTGLFKGHNLIMITAEAFSSYAINPEITPTLYKMTREGFVFTNFYNPVWWVSTSDGEYVACTSLLPKSGVWSFYQSGKNFMPFVMGNQFKKLGYITKAYHNHTYTYYKRHISHPNMGYDYKGMGNGLEAYVKETWPESDLEMIEATVGEYAGSQPFHAYYMTVSGHMNYNFFGNYIARKNKNFVDHLPYSDEAKAYLACNMELEFAVKALIEKLEAAGVIDNTVIAISADHYPYGLPKECIDELAGHEVESNFELHKSTFILWKKGMSPVLISKPCSSLDIIPTLSNLFGLEYDSRLLMGRDILSDSPGLVIFSNRSWITDRARFNSITNTVEFYDGTENDPEYVKQINSIVAKKFEYSTRILDTDYYRKVVPGDAAGEN